MRKAATEEQFREAVGSIAASGGVASGGAEVTVAVFKASWCPDCHFIEPFMPEVERAYSGRIQFIEVDRDELPELCSEWNILGIPSFIAFRNGSELVRFVSKLRKTRDEIEQFLGRALEVSTALQG